MPFRYASLPGSSAAQERELEETFAVVWESDDEDDDSPDAESKPLNPRREASPPPEPASGTTGATYDFENLDYDYPPPGSPPGPTMAVPNNPIGNNNGRIPTSPPQIPTPRRQGLFHRAVQVVFPGLRHHVPAHVGGGIENDGVFANINAKPSRGRVVNDGDNGIYVVPEDVQTEAPPSYASAQADAVPPYWETTIHAPSGFGGIGEMMVDGLPTGSVFSFLWNFLVSMSFQFVGFLLTFLLHSTHAAKLGSRAGLGVTLIHYGFYLRTKSDVFSSDFFSETNNNSDDSWWPATSTANTDSPIATRGAQLADYVTNSTVSSLGENMSEGTSEWLSFLLMTVGWFILLTSVLSFWRVKRWERSIVASNPPEENRSESHHPFAGVETALSFPGAIWRRLRSQPPRDEEATLESHGNRETDRMLSVGEDTDPANDPNTGLDTRALAEIRRIRQERLQQRFRDAGLII
ncbi:hypothetical protein M422DRAFT_22866 [Sphaerobolus stellatus SS14]|nr:hypothetical protein M422DRAFT_22866 [Sphaerobolus stellatus SS14]